jgi:hypothetical protein
MHLGINKHCEADYVVIYSHQNYFINDIKVYVVPYPMWANICVKYAIGSAQKNLNLDLEANHFIENHWRG